MAWACLSIGLAPAMEGKIPENPITDIHCGFDSGVSQEFKDPCD